MTHCTRTPAIVLLVALVLFVGVPQSLFALDRLPYSGSTSGSGPGDISSAPEMVADDGDPDDWASSTEAGEGADGTSQAKTADDDAKWRNYLDTILDLILRIKMELAGIL